MEVVGMESQSTRRMAVEWVRPKSFPAVLAGAAVAALTVYIISEPATAHAADSPAATRAAAVLTDQSPPALGRIMPVDDTFTDDDDSAQQQQQMLQDELQADQQMQQAEQQAEEQNELAQQEAQQAEQQGLLTEQEANLQVP
jgi:hypothetical protein